MKNPLVSIIIPTYNRGHLIGETLSSLVAQTYTNWECIIVDDASTDNSFGIIKDFVKNDNRFKIVKKQLSSIKGPSSCRNYGFELSTGNYIQFFDSDDIMHQDHLLKKIKAIEDNDFVVCKIREFSGTLNEEGSFKGKYVDMIKVDNIFESFATGEFYMLMMFAPMWKKSSISLFMPMREDMHILEDHELYARILFSKNKYAIINEELIYYRVGSSSLLNNFYSNVKFGLDSYFEAKKTVLKLSSSTKIKYSILKSTLSLFRMAMAQKQFESAKSCLRFCSKYNLAYSTNLKLKMVRIHILFIFVLITKRGDTYFKNHFKV
jgi:glycosyltransferase involved in cell wall biosynthesis